MEDDDILARPLSIQITDFPDVDEAWIEEKTRAIAKDLVDRLGPKLEWGQVVSFLDGTAIGLALLFARGNEYDPELPDTVFRVICQHTGIELPNGRGKAKRKGGLPRMGLGPRFPAAYYKHRGRIPGVSPVIHPPYDQGERSGTQKSRRQGA